MLSKRKYNRIDTSQESQYELPYHYIPQFENGHFTQSLHWSWGFRYLGGIQITLELLREERFESLLDIGCGDGRFLREVNGEFQGKKLLGIDISERAVNLAQAMNPNLKFKCLNICYDSLIKQQFDVITLIEVLEHIPTQDVDHFVHALSQRLKPKGVLLLTVPHKNKPLQFKHYQHFDSKSLTKLLAPFFEIDRCFFFDKKSRMFGLFSKYLLQNSLFMLNNQFLLDLFFKIYKKYLFFCQEVDCGRICLVGKKR